MTPNCPTDHIPMTKVANRKRTWKCPKCNLKMTKPWKRTKIYGTLPPTKFNTSWNTQINQEMKEETIT